MDELAELLQDVLGDNPAPGVWSWPDDRLLTTLDTLHHAEHRIIAAQLTILREIDGRGLGKRLGGATTTAWLRNRHHLHPATAARRIKLAAALDTDLPATSTALANGTINTEQAQAIAEAVTQLPTGLRAEGEQRMLTRAQHTDPKILAAAGTRLLDELDPIESDRRAHNREARLAERAHKARTLRLIDVPGTAVVRIRGQVDREAAAIIRTGLDALCSPRRDLLPQHYTGRNPTGTDYHVPAERTADQRRIDALIEIFRIALASQQLPDNGGDRPQVVITTPLQTLQDAYGTANLENGETLTAEAARRWACDANIIPIILGLVFSRS